MKFLDWIPMPLRHKLIRLTKSYQVNGTLINTSKTGRKQRGGSKKLTRPMKLSLTRTEGKTMIMLPTINFQIKMLTKSSRDSLRRTAWLTRMRKSSSINTIPTERRTTMISSECLEMPQLMRSRTLTENWPCSSTPRTTIHQMLDRDSTRSMRPSMPFQMNPERMSTTTGSSDRLLPWGPTTSSKISGAIDGTSWRTTASSDPCSPANGWETSTDSSEIASMSLKTCPSRMDNLRDHKPGILTETESNKGRLWTQEPNMRTECQSLRPPKSITSLMEPRRSGRLKTTERVTQLRMFTTWRKERPCPSLTELHLIPISLFY